MKVWRMTLFFEKVKNICVGLVRDPEFASLLSSIEKVIKCTWFSFSNLNMECGCSSLCRDKSPFHSVSLILSKVAWFRQTELRTWILDYDLGIPVAKLPVLKLVINECNIFMQGIRLGVNNFPSTNSGLYSVVTAVW